MVVARAGEGPPHCPPWDRAPGTSVVDESDLASDQTEPASWSETGGGGAVTTVCLDGLVWTGVCKMVTVYIAAIWV